MRDPNLAVNSILLYLSKYGSLLRQPVEFRIAKLALLFYAGCWLAWYDLSQIAESVLILCFFFALGRPKAQLFRDPLFIVIVVWIFYQLVVVPKAIEEFPDLAEAQIDYAGHYSKVALILVVAWALNGSIVNATGVLMFLAVGFVLGSVFQNGGLIDSIDAVTKGVRSNFGYKNEAHTAVYATLSFFILLFLGPRITEIFFESRKWLGYSLLTIGVSYSLMVIVLAKTRASWIALGVAVFVMLFTFAITRLKTKRVIAPSKAITGGSLILALTVASAFLAKDQVVERIRLEQPAFEALANGNFDRVPITTSLGERIAIWRLGLHSLDERIWTGWGPKTRAHLFHEKAPEWMKEYGYGHFHNSYIELLYGYGILGLVIFGTIAVLLFNVVLTAWRSGLMPSDFALLGFTFGVFWFIVNCSESFLNYSTGAYVNALVGGVLYTFKKTRKHQIAFLSNARP